MKRILLVILFALMIGAPFTNKASALDYPKENFVIKTVEIKGAFQFDCSLSSRFMKKHGYTFIEESYYASYLTTNIYGAKDAEVIVENEQGIYLGTGQVDEKGQFSINVPPQDTYRIVARFHNRDTDKMVKLKDIDGIIMYVGFFESEAVDMWIRASLDDCIPCARYAKK